MKQNKNSNTKDLRVVMLMYNLIEYIHNYWKKHLDVYANFAEISQTFLQQVLGH